MNDSLDPPVALGRGPFFSSMSPPLVARAEACIVQRDCAPREVIYAPEDPCSHVYWISRGRVKVNRVSGDGRQLCYRHLVAGDIFGEECLVEREARSDYAEVIEASQLYQMLAADFRLLCREEVSFAYTVAQRLCRRSREVEQTLADTVFTSVRRRVASGLLRLYRQEQETKGDTLRVTHQEVASLAGSTRETTTSVLHGLRADGILRLANRRLTVLDPEALEQLATEE